MDKSNRTNEVIGTCPECGARVLLAAVNAEEVAAGVEFRTYCPACAAEVATSPTAKTTKASEPNEEAYVGRTRRPYGADEWARLSSSNLDAAGRAGEDLLVRFKSGATYRYAGAGDLLHALAASESAGRFFHAKVKRFPTIKLCAVYGCGEPAEAGGTRCAIHGEGARHA